MHPSPLHPALPHPLILQTPPSVHPFPPTRPNPHHPGPSRIHPLHRPPRRQRPRIIRRIRPRDHQRGQAESWREAWDRW
ncbi:hypothetical protein I314_04972 [Cryptococcus bacillisporus CA1873]|uniref:Unplaced genomic scaffold supercont1.14, whole genome shotgun sequence n=2 Tax=Cryptococcus gattii TaxID=552467 RepID=A0A0D0VET6_CRYGA|nr:hypothetical protein I312_04951 [Cryptococcus bacillisporus CA1280]KIR58988.1 hypothetical protein I314_04972 [Cryptococcus bacillisporus CA1873]|eukprot:KIR58988.1 hypothetical protein I314_04972 [Cryptococcus gattii CA1873]